MFSKRIRTFLIENNTLINREKNVIQLEHKIINELIDKTYIADSYIDAGNGEYLSKDELSILFPDGIMQANWEPSRERTEWEKEMIPSYEECSEIFYPKEDIIESNDEDVQEQQSGSESSVTENDEGETDKIETDKIETNEINETEHKDVIEDSEEEFEKEPEVKDESEEISEKVSEEVSENELDNTSVPERNFINEINNIEEKNKEESNEKSNNNEEIKESDKNLIEDEDDNQQIQEINPYDCLEPDESELADIPFDNLVLKLRNGKICYIKDNELIYKVNKISNINEYKNSLKHQSNKELDIICYGIANSKIEAAGYSLLQSDLKWDWYAKEDKIISIKEATMIISKLEEYKNYYILIK